MLSEQEILSLLNEVQGMIAREEPNMLPLHKITELAKEVIRLREALEWYGKLEGEWRSECTISPNTPFSRSWEQSEPFDIGKRARDALEGK